MEQEKEIEFKSLMDKKKWKKAMEKVMQFADKKGTYKQTNYYFDTEEHALKHKKITCRIRQKEGKWEATVKIKSMNSYGAAESIERNLPLDETTASKMLQEGMETTSELLQPLFEGIELTEGSVLNLLGELTTTRTDFQYYQDIISFDESEYLDQKDYELEWETTNEKSTLFLVKEVLHVPIGNAKGKKNRFLDAVEKKQKARG